MIAPNLAQLLRVELRQIEALEEDAVSEYLARRLGYEAKHRKRRHRLAAPRLAHDPERLSRI